MEIGKKITELYKQKELALINFSKPVKHTLTKNNYHGRDCTLAH